MNYEIVAIILVIYLLGFLLSYWMLITEVKSLGEVTIGAKALCFALSFLSWLMVIWALSVAWVKSISKTGYWARPVKKTETKL